MDNTAPKTWIQYDKTLPYIENRDPAKRPTSHLEKVGENSYKVVEGRRRSKMLLVNKLREAVDEWRDKDYPDVTNTTKELLYFWFFNDHRVNNELFRFWFCQREAIETLIYLFEVKRYNDIVPVIKDYAEDFSKSQIVNTGVEIVERPEGERELIRYFPESNQIGSQDLPEKGLLRYAFKMATGSGKTLAMALIIVWSYFNRIKEKNTRYPDNFLIVAPNVIVYERLKKDFKNNEIFYRFPLIPHPWKPHWGGIKVTLSKEDSICLYPSGNIIVTNIQQLYESRKVENTADNIIDEILGRKPQKDLTKSPELLIDKIKKLGNLMVINDEAHHVHDEDLAWHKTLISIHKSIPNGLNLWLDFSATPKTQTGTYYPWIIVDYPLAQAVEDRIVKAPLIVHTVDKKDPKVYEVTKDNVIQKYGDWISAALERWKKHYEVYTKVGKKPVLFIMAEKNDYADKIAEYIRKTQDLGLNNPEEEVLVIHVKTTKDAVSETEIRISEKDLPILRELVSKIDETDNKVKIIVSNLMLREGWDVQNVTIILGLRPFTSKAEILPEQAVGRGLRLMRGISAEPTQTLEVMGTEAFENFVRELEIEGVGINTEKTPPPLPVVIAPEKGRMMYDIEIPTPELRFLRNYKNLDQLDPLKIPPLYTPDKLNERKIQLKMEFQVTGTEVHREEIVPVPPTGRELLSDITKSVMGRAGLTCEFTALYPVIEKYILERCFGTTISDIEDKRLRDNLSDITVQEEIVAFLAKQIGNLSVEEKKFTKPIGSLKLSSINPFTWRRKHIRCKKTIFSFVAVYNDFEAEFAEFLDNAPDIEKFSAFGDNYSIDYLSSRGPIRFYYPDFVAVQNVGGNQIFWIIETKGREYEDTDRKDAAIKKWCEDLTKNKKQTWKYLKVLQKEFEKIKDKCNSFEDLLHNLSTYTEEIDKNKENISQSFEQTDKNPQEKE